MAGAVRRSFLAIQSLRESYEKTRRVSLLANRPSVGGIPVRVQSLGRPYENTRPLMVGLFRMAPRTGFEPEDSTT